MAEDDKRVTLGISLSSRAARILDEVSEKTGRSKSTVIEILIALYANNLTLPDCQVPFNLLPTNSRKRKRKS